MRPINTCELEGLFRSAGSGGGRERDAGGGGGTGANEGLLDSMFGVSSEEMKRRMGSMSEATKLRMAQVCGFLNPKPQTLNPKPSVA